MPKQETWASAKALAEACMDEKSNNLGEAAELMYGRLQGATWNDLGDQVINHACHDLCMRARHDRRQKLSPFKAVKSGPERVPGATRGADAAARRLAGGAELNLFDHWGLSSGILLGDATKPDIAGERDVYAAIIAKNEPYRAWFDKIHGAMKGKRPLREQLTPQQVQRLAKENGVSG